MQNGKAFGLDEVSFGAWNMIGEIWWIWSIGLLWDSDDEENAKLL